MLLFLMLMRYAFARIHNTQFFFSPEKVSESYNIPLSLHI